MAGTTFSQETLEEKKARADEFFKTKNWNEAEPIYAAVIFDSPKNHDLNFRYGTCLLYGSKNKDEAIKRLRFSITGQGIDKRAYYYLGQAYHLNYQFNEAIKHYTTFKGMATPAELKELDVNTDIKACEFGKKLLANVTDMVVLQKTELKSERFYDLYKLNDIGGTLLITDAFQSKLDKKNNHRPIIHFPVNSPYIYYSSYGEDGSTGLDIYVKKKLPGGEWSLEQKVRGQVNTELDEDFAYMHPNGRYLYFCSKGHNSMGGYDVFRSLYNPDDQSFGPPENLDFAISSPDDDLLFVVDSLDRIAYFSSARESGQGNITVYKVRVDRIPMQMAVIKGNFLNTVQADQKEVEIEIEDFSSGRIIGKFNSKKNNGDYLITFPKSGKYRYIITPEDSDVSHIYIVDIPYSKEFRPLKQSMTLKLDGSGEEFIEVTDQFNESFDDPTAVMAEVYRELSKLPPNAASFNLDSLDALKATDAVLVDAGLDPYLTNDGLVALLKGEVEDIEAAKTEEEKQANIAYNVAQEKSDLANAKMVELNKLLEEAENASSETEKRKALSNLIELKEEIEDLNNEAQSLIDLAEVIEKSVADKNEKLNQAKMVQTAANNLPEGDRAALIDLVQKNNTFFTENVKNNPPLDNSVTDALQLGSKEQKRVQKLSEDVSELNKSVRELEKENKNLTDQLALEKKGKVQAEIQAKIDANKGEIAVLNQNIEAKSRELEKAIKENESVRNGVAAAIVLKDDYTNSNYENALSETEKKEITSKVKSNDLQDNLTLVDDVLEKNNVSSFNIDLYANDEKTSNYSLEDWNAAIDEANEKLRLEKLNASQERQKEIQAEIDRLERLRAEKQASYELVKEADPSTIPADVKEDDIVTDFQQRKGQIDQILNETDRKEAEIDLNNELLLAIEKEKKRLEKIQAENPKAKNISERINNLEILSDEAKNTIRQNQDWLAENNSSKPVSKDEILTNLEPDYQQKINAAYELVDDNARDEAVRDLNEMVLEKANERTQELEAILDSDPSNQKAKDELEVLEDFVNELKANKELALVEPNATNLEELSAEVEVTDLVENYDSRKKAIEGISDEYQRKKAENELYSEVVDEARNELAKMDRLAEKNPENKTIIKRQEALRDLDRDLNKLKIKNNEWLDKNKPEEPTFADANTVRMVNADYQVSLDKINQLPNEKDRQRALEDLNATTLKKVENRLNELDAILNQNPTNAAAAKEKKDLLELQKLINDQKDQPLMAALSAENIQTNPTAKDLLTTYDLQLEEIDGSQKTEVEKAEDRIALNERLRTLVDAELKAIDEQIQLNPDQADLLNERKTALENLNLKAENDIAEDTKRIIQSDSASSGRSPVTESTLMPDYEKDLATIRGSNQTQKEKLMEENNLNKILLAAIDYKLTELENELKENPDSEAEIKADIESLTEARKEKQNLVDKNQTELDGLATDIEVASRPIISVGNLIPDYEVQLADIRNGAGTDPEKLEKENELHQSLIDRTDKRIAELEAEKEQNPDQAIAIDKDIEKLRNIKRSTQNSININKDQLAQLTANQLNRPEITIGSLIPDFETRLAGIENKNLSETEKLEEKNALNAELLKAIDRKIVEVQEAWEEDPNNGFVYNEEINKLEELKESKTNEIVRNTDQITDLEASTANVGAVKATDFKTDEGREAVTQFDRELAEINELNTDLAGYKQALNATTDPKEIEKIQKNIDKTNQAKMGLENKVIEGLADANESEVNTAKADLTTDKQLTSNAAESNENGLAEELQTANENLIIANEKMAEAKSLRDQAAKEKDNQIANEKLKSAFQLEEEAKALVNESNRIFKMARAANNYADEETVITSVPENLTDRKSTQLLDEAGELRRAANVYYDRAKELRDSSATVKKKYVDAVIEQANVAELKGDELNRAAEDKEIRAEEIKTQEDQFLARSIESVEKNVDSETTENLATSVPYKAYFEEKNKGDEKLTEANALDSEIAAAKNTRARRFKMAVSGTAEEPAAAIENDNEIAEAQAKIDSLTALQKKLRDEALTNYENAKAILNNQNTDQQENMMALEQKDIKPFERKKPANADFEVPENLETDIFRTTNNAIYSNEAPIPVSQKQPSGLVYKVQVGAFRNALPQDHFKEFAPISGELLNNGITRYMVGYFTTYNPANEAKTKVNDMGYKDAFVVAYCNGDRITIDRAKLIEQGLIKCDGTEEQNTNNQFVNNSNTTNNTNTSENNSSENNTTNGNTNNGGNDNNNTTNNNTQNSGTNSTNNSDNLEDQSATLNIVPTTTEERALTNYYTSVPDAAKANQIEIIKGLFYTVQIGVYSKPVPNSALFNIQPLNSQRTPTGYVRYSTGIFTSEEAAAVRRNEVIQIGIADAFVTAYFNGERITVEEALQLLIRDGADILVGKTQSVTEVDTNTTDVQKETFNKEALYYRILIGKYEDAIPGEYATLLLRGDGIFETEVDQEGRTCLISRNIDSYEQMIDHLTEFADLGIEDMEIVTYYKYDVIPFQESEKIRKGEELDELHPLDEMEGISANDFIYNKEAVYFKVKLGEFEDKVPGDFTNLLLLHEVEENIYKEETINDETVFMTGSIKGYSDAEETRKRLLDKGFDRAIIVAYHKYDEISIEKAREIVGD